MDGSISQFLKMQHDLAVEKGWMEDRTPEKAPLSILWSIDELGEAIAIIKKKGAYGIMNNESVRGHFVEELSDTFMYLFDMMESYGITADEFTRAYIKKYEHNMGRSWHENEAMYERCSYRLVIFDLTDALPLAPRLLEILSKTELHPVLLAREETADELLTSHELERDMFDLCLFGEDTAELLRLALEKYNASPDKVVVCTAGADCARLAEEGGMTVYSVSADRTLDGLQDLLGFCG